MMMHILNFWRVKKRLYFGSKLISCFIVTLLLYASCTESTSHQNNLHEILRVSVLTMHNNACPKEHGVILLAPTSVELKYKARKVEI